MSGFAGRHTLRRVVNEFQLRREAKTLALEIDAKLGFFAQLNWCLYILAYCEERGLHPTIRLTGAQYSETPNRDWFHDFFDENHSREGAIDAPQETEASREITLSIRHINETSFADLYAPSMTIELAHQLFTKHYRIKDRVKAYVDDFIARELSNRAAVGLHFRGTDKRYEAQPVNWSRCFHSVVKYVSDHPEVRTVFLSSDDPHFINWFSHEARGTVSVVTHPDEERSRDARPVHVNRSGNGHRKGFEALVNCLLLSRCAALIRTASFLSGWSSVFNPRLPVTLLNEPYAQTSWFPDRELIGRSDNRYR
jgi:Nodulation protein Z (NodZ)